MIEAEVSQKNSKSSTIKWINKYVCRKTGRNADEGQREPTLRWLSDAEAIHHCGCGCTLCCPQLYLMKPPTCKWACPFSFIFFFSLCSELQVGVTTRQKHNRDSQIMYGWRAPYMQNQAKSMFLCLFGRHRWSTKPKLFVFKAVRKEMQKSTCDVSY